MSAGYELSPQQKRIFAQGLENSSAGLAILLEGVIEPRKIREIVQALVGRHEILRTAFQRRTGMKFPFQVVQESVQVSWDDVDLSALRRPEQRFRIQELLRDSSKLDIEKGPVTHAWWAKLADNRQALVLTFSVLCVDNASLNRIFSELSELLSGKALSPDVLQYADYSEWQNETLHKDDEESREAGPFWKRLENDPIPAPSLPFERKNAAGPHGWEETPLRFEFPDGSKTIEAILLACWQIFLWRMTGQQELVIGYRSDGRNHEEFAAGVGVFAKPLPVRSNFEQEPTFLDFSRESGKQLSAAIECQDYLSDELLGSHLPIGFALSRLAEEIAVNGVVLSEFARFVPSEFRLELRHTGRGDSWTPTLAFDPSYFRREVVAELAARFTALLRAAPSGESLVGTIAVMDEEERRKVVSDFNYTAAEYPADQCIHQLFETRAAQHPDRPALRFGDRELRYSELNQEANRIAHVLAQNGVRANVPVALCLERSAEMIVGLLGILKAGGCYVPLVPDNPKTRLAHQLSETGAPVLLTEQQHLDRLPQFKGKIICLDRDRELLAGAPETNPNVGVSPENLVYVIYTSGSTGAPKGVAVRHSNLVNYSHFICKRLDLDKYSDGLHFATVSTISADLGNTCIFPALISGGCLHVIGYELAMSPSLFADYVSHHPVDVLKITPSHLASLLDSRSSVLPRKYLILGGEAARWGLIELVRQAGSCAIFNHYGPTEATVGCCTFSVDHTDVSAWGPATVPIGRPIANDQVYIVDSRMQPVPVGVAGELCIGGTGLAQGYLNQPQQTAERFVHNPFSDDPAARLYRTGDLARFLPDGNIEFLGRIDQQVKIRGFRVEPAEIEAVVKRHASVKQAAVVPYDDKTGEKWLAAYVVGRCRAEELRAFLAQELPDYMVPASFVLLDSLPLTSNGKLDMRALPSPEQQIAEREFVAPRTPEEEKLAGIWKKVLKLDHVGITDNFFELGGHSLLATQIISRIRSGFKVQMQLYSFLQNPTIAALAEQISQCPAIESEEDEMTRLLQELEGISEEEAERLLAAELEKDKRN